MIQAVELSNSEVGLLPVCLPLLGESVSVSFPPLIDMLELRFWPCVMQGRGPSTHRSGHNSVAI